MRRIIVITIVLAGMLPLSGCRGWIDQKVYYHNVMYVGRMQLKRNKPDFCLLSNAETVQELLKSIRNDIDFDIHARGSSGMYSAYENARVIREGDIMLVGLPSNEKRVWSHIFLLRQTEENKTEVFFVRAHFDSAHLNKNKDSAYYFNWKKALIEEGAKQGIMTYKK